MTSKRKVWNRIAWMGGAVSLLALPTLAGAQTYTVHPVTMGLKTVYQDEANNGNDKIGKEGGNQKDLFELCTGDKPTKDQGTFLQIDCDDPSINRLVLANTDPVSIIETIGSIDFIENSGADQEKGDGELTKTIIPVVVPLSCSGGDYTATLFGVATVKYKPLPSPSDMICPNNASISLAGWGFDDTDLGYITINVGSKINAKNRTTSVTLPAIPVVISTGD